MNTSRSPLPDSIQAHVAVPSTPGTRPMRHDPILEELWAVKARLNVQANYDVRRLLADAAATAAALIDANGQLRV